MVNKTTESNTRTETVLIHETPVAVEVQLSAKGDYYYNCKVHTKTVSEAMSMLAEVDGLFKAKYKKEG